MSSYHMRQELKKIYQSPSWDAKVDRMSDSQVFAVYRKFVELGTIK